MQSNGVPLAREVVLIGGGHTHALVLRRWGMRPLPGARLTLINPGATAPYTGMLPGFVAGHYPREALDIDLVRLARFAGARLILGRATGIDRDTRRIAIEGRAPIAYDLASIDIGITSAMADLPGFTENAVAAKPLGPFATRWTAFRESVLADGAAPRIAVIGGGVGGVELAMAMAHALGSAGCPPRITVLDRDRALPEFDARGRDRLLTRAERLGVTLREGVEVAAVEPGAVVLEAGERVGSDFTVGAAGARPYGWLGETGLALENGFVAVDDTLRSLTDPRLYAVGDCAHLTRAPRPKAGVYAVRQAPFLYANLRADLTGRQRQHYRPQTDHLKLVSLGERAALAEKAGLVLEGAWLWRLKDRIDRAFMDKFIRLEPMRPPRPPRLVAEGADTAAAPLCGGCGAKVGAPRLARALDDLPAVRREDVRSTPGDDAAVLAFGKTRQVLTTDHLRAFVDDPWTLSRIAAIHALGDVWAMAAAPQAALASIILPRMAPRMQDAWLAEIMAAAAEVFAAEGAEIVGGHTTMGAELTIGFTVTGIAGDAPVGLDGARPGDALILTKPLGTGVVLAAEMQLAAAGDDVAAVLGGMAQSQGAAARLLTGAHALTDVTGFGLAGHLLNLCRASRAGARLDLSALPLYPGAAALLKDGHRSTLDAENRAAVEDAITGADPEDPATAILFDPQTAGGLLAAIDPAEADTIIARLAETGLAPARVGEIVAGPAQIALT